MPALSWLMNLGFAGSSTPAPVVAVTPAVDKGRDSGGGRKPLTYVDPWELYGTPKKRLKVKEARARLRKVRQAMPEEVREDLAPLTARVTDLVRQITAFEKKVDSAQRDVEVAGLSDQYRQMAAQRERIETELKAAEHRARLFREDEEFINMIVELL